MSVVDARASPFERAWPNVRCARKFGTSECGKVVVVTDMHTGARSPATVEFGRIGLALAGVLAGLAASAFWAGGSVVSRSFMVTASVPPEDLALLRYAGAFPAAFALVLLLPRRVRSDIPLSRLLVLLLLAGPLYQALLIWGYRYATAGSGALLVTGMVPVFSLGLALLPFGRVRPVFLSTMAGALLVVVGLLVYALAAPATLAIQPMGIAIFATAAAMWALLNVLVAKWSIEPRRLTIALVLFSPLFLPLWFLQPHATGPTPQLFDMPWRDVALQVVVHGWLGAIVATTLFLFCVRATGAPTAAILQAVTPAFAAGFGEIALGEHLLPLQLAGMALVILGMVLATLGVARRGAASRGAARPDG